MSFMKSSALAALTLTLVAGIAPASADTLLIDALAQEPPNSPQGLPRPGNGMTASEVLARFGEPRQRIAPVGNPPISRWVYDAYIVYFERDRVITSVVKR